MNDRIFVITSKKDEAFLRTPTREVDFSLLTKKEIRDIIVRMRDAMRKADGIGLAANQIGISYRIFVAEVPDGNRGKKSYAIVNPFIESFGEEATPLEEGCLSIPGVYGIVERPSRVTLKGYDKNGKVIKIKAWGLLAKVFQHEVDHLNGVLFIDKAKSTYSIPLEDRLLKRETNIR